jgi:hypothetical protein
MSKARPTRERAIMSQVFTVNWVGDRTKSWQHAPSNTTNIDYTVAFEGYESTVKLTRKSTSQPPKVGDQVYGGIIVQTPTDPKTGETFEVHKFKSEQRPAQSGQGANGVSGDTFKAPGGAQDSDWWYAKDRRISRAGVMQAVVASGVFNDGVQTDGYVRLVNALTDDLLESLDGRTPHPSAPKTEATPPAQAQVHATPPFQYEDVTPKTVAEGTAPIADGDDIPF